MRPDKGVYANIRRGGANRLQPKLCDYSRKGIFEMGSRVGWGGVDPVTKISTAAVASPREPMNILFWNPAFSRQLRQGGERTSRNLVRG